MKDFICLADLSPESLSDLLDLAVRLKKDHKAEQARPLLKNKVLGMVFAKSSTRTRVSFEVGMLQLGGQALFLSDRDLQLGRGESLADTAQVLSRFVDGLMIRTHRHQDVIDLAQAASIPVINGLTDQAHPCQALADLLTIQEHHGTLNGLKLAYLGDGNNVAQSLLVAAALAGMDMAVASPAGHGCREDLVERARQLAQASGSSLLLTHDPLEAVEGAHAVYTDTWVSMGQEAEKDVRIQRFGPYQVNQNLMDRASKGALFMHCLPAYRGLEVTAQVIDGPASVVFDQAENRLHAQKAVLVRLLAAKGL